MVDVQRSGIQSFASRSQVIIPMSNFSCSGRLTGYMISLNLVGTDSSNYPTIQVWRPTSSVSYDLVEGQYELVAADVTDNGGYHLANVTLTGVNRIQFQSSDVIGYYLPSNVNFYSVWNIQTMGYTSYMVSLGQANSIPTTATITTDMVADSQPLIQVIFGEKI